jgi:L-Ala-D/L-Glu epimerase
VKIVSVETWRERVPLSRPYTIAYATIDSADLFFVRILGDGREVGLGSAAPMPDVTGESPGACAEALEPEHLAWLAGRDVAEISATCRLLEGTHRNTPAARAALDTALHDLFARSLGKPLAEVLGRCHDALPTSVTVGIQGVEEALAEVDVHLARGFTHLKVKIGRSFDEDVERLRRIRERAGASVRIRIDANQGYDLATLLRLAPVADEIDAEFVEQPLPAGFVEGLRTLPRELVRSIALDESVLSEGDALEAAREPAACGIFNVKLMKCGGILPALSIAKIARTADIGLLWGCNDESRISIAAALHAASSCPATKYLDLDGHLDLARDPALGGFTIEDGRMRLTGKPGLGVRLVDRP